MAEYKLAARTLQIARLFLLSVKLYRKKTTKMQSQITFFPCSNHILPKDNIRVREHSLTAFNFQTNTRQSYNIQPLRVAAITFHVCFEFFFKFTFYFVKSTL